ncbi:hypothetical protein EG834_15215, partial [bacterium]|nr:hypothetical protein [bacterium]
EYLRDRGNSKFFTWYDEDTDYFTAVSPDEVFSVTATVQYDLWKNVISRLELRWDRAVDDPHVYGGKEYGAGDQEDAWMLAANLIYRF